MRLRCMIPAVFLTFVSIPFTLTAQVLVDCATAGGSNCTALIPDANKGISGQLESTMLVSDEACGGVGQILDVNASVALIHDWVGDLRITLVHPDGSTFSRLLSPMINNLDDDVNATFNDELPAAKDIPAIGDIRTPATPLAVFDGSAVAGTWTLRVEDLNNSGYGALRAWSLDIACGLATVTVTASDPDAAEPGADTGAFTVSRGEASTGDLNVSYGVGGTAAAGVDYIALPGTITIADGSTSAIVPVQPMDDLVQETPETVVLTLVAGVDYTVGTPGSATVTIADDGDPAAVGQPIPTVGPLGILIIMSLIMITGFYRIRARV